MSVINSTAKNPLTENRSKSKMVLLFGKNGKTPALSIRFILLVFLLLWRVSLEASWSNRPLQSVGFQSGELSQGYGPPAHNLLHTATHTQTLIGQEQISAHVVLETVQQSDPIHDLDQ